MASLGHTLDLQITQVQVPFVMKRPDAVSSQNHLRDAICHRAAAASAAKPPASGRVNVSAICPGMYCKY